MTLRRSTAVAFTAGLALPFAALGVATAGYPGVALLLVVNALVITVWGLRSL